MTEPEATPLPDVLLDRVVFGLHVRLVGVGAERWAETVGKLLDLGFKKDSNARPGLFAFHAETVELPADAEATVFGKLAVTHPTDDLTVVTNSSTVGFNLTTALATTLSDTAPGLCLDGNVNVAGAHCASYPSWLAAQLAIVDEAMAAIVDALAKEAGGPVEGEFWVKEAEVYRDHPVSDAIGVVTSLRDSLFPGVNTSTCKKVPAKGDAKGRFLHLLSWSDGRKKGSPRWKLYPKTRTSVRAELALDTRKAVKHFLEKTGVRAASATLPGGSPSELLLPLIHAAVPELDKLKEHADQGQPPVLSQLWFLAGLAPLLRVVNPEAGKLGRGLSEKTTDAAYEVLAGLLGAGACRVAGTDKGRPPRSALEEMAEDPGGLVQQGEGRDKTTFFVRPEWESARLAFAGALALPLGTDQDSSDRGPEQTEAPEESSNSTR